MKSLEITDIILNPVLGARVIWPAIDEYQKSNTCIPLPLALLILPIALHRRSRKFIFKMNKSSGSISKAINKRGNDALISGNDLSLGLQERLNYTIPLSLSSLNIGIASGLFSEAPNDNYQFPCYKTEHLKIPGEVDSTSGDETDEKQKASARLGAWFSNSTLETIYSSLKVTI